MRQYQPLHGLTVFHAVCQHFAVCQLQGDAVQVESVPVLHGFSHKALVMHLVQALQDEQLDVISPGKTLLILNQVVDPLL